MLKILHVSNYLLDHGNWIEAKEIIKSSNQEFDNFISNESNNNESVSTSNEFDKINTNQIQNNDFIDGNSKTNNIENNKKTAPKKLSKWDDEEDEEIVEEVVEEKKQVNIIDLTIKHEDFIIKSYKNSDSIGIQAALGNIEKVKKLLKTQLAIYEISSLKPILKDIYLSSHTQIKLSPCSKSQELILRNVGKDNIVKPHSIVNLNFINEQMNSACEYIDNKELEKAEFKIRKIISLCIFIIPNNEEEIEQIKELIRLCTEYLYLIKLLNISELKKNDKYLYSELCLLTTLCRVKPIHKFLMLKRAKVSTKNVKNYITSFGLIYKMLAMENILKDFEDLGFDKLLTEYNSLKDKTNDKDYRFNIKELEKKPISEVLNYSSLEVLSNSKIQCSLCEASFESDLKNSDCQSCKLSILGKECTGIQLSIKN